MTTFLRRRNALLLALAPFASLGPRAQPKPEQAELLRKLQKLATVDDLTVLDRSSGTLWLDVAARRWSPELLAATGLSEAHMPRLVEGSEVSARLRPLLTSRSRW